MLDIIGMWGPMIVRIEVPGERVEEGRHGLAAWVLPLEW